MLSTLHVNIYTNKQNAGEDSTKAPAAIIPNECMREAAFLDACYLLEEFSQTPLD